MKKYQFLKISALTLGLAFSFESMADQVLRIATWASPAHPQNSVVFPTWGKWVEEATEGRVKVELEYGMGHPKTMFDLVEDGVVDASWSYHGYVPGRFILTQAVEQPLMDANAEAASVAYWRAHQKYFAKADEHAGLHVLGLFTHGPGQIHTAKPLESLADLKGMKIRLGGGVQAELGKRLSITAVGAPGSKVYEMMQQGIVDGVFMPVASQKDFRLTEVAPNLTLLPGGMYLGSFSFFINPEFLDSLSSKDREAILSVSGEKFSALAGAAWDAGDVAGLAEAKKMNVNINMVSGDEAMVEEFRTAITGMDEHWIEAASQRGIDGAAALADLRKNIAEYNQK
ncbi:TRAP transporter substrate-binding protein [Amphritea sp. HPY]|uniref:TRAP transporter substrate-binding protein n=1 Tax=Amphritea sp. HPY TaxID=3421652 RepID=UPI003D7D9C82